MDRKRQAQELIKKLFIVYKTKLCLTRYNFDFKMRTQNRYCLTILMQSQHKDHQFNSKRLLKKFLQATQERGAMIKEFTNHHLTILKVQKGWRECHEAKLKAKSETMDLFSKIVQHVLKRLQDHKQKNPNLIKTLMLLPPSFKDQVIS